MAARITGEAHHFESSEATARKFLSMPNVSPWFTGFGNCALALVAVERNDVAAAAELYPALEPVRAMMFPYVSGYRVSGLLSVIIGDHEQAVAHFEDALAFCRRAGYRPELAWTCYDYAGGLVKHALIGSAQASSSDHARAVSLLDEALAVSRELGMLPLMERVIALQEQAQLPSPSEYPDGLTQREVEVLVLLALGKSNREIAQELFITEATVRRHVSNIYDKIGVSNRTEATRYALKEALLSLDEMPSS